MLDYFHQASDEMLANGELIAALANYDGPQGKDAFVKALARKQADGSHKKVLLPLAPEYIGYGDAGIDEDIFISYQPEIELLDNGLFKYHVDFEQLTVDDSIAAICASRPTNPTGNVLTFPNIIFADVQPFWNDNTILCMSLSKLGLPGVRCGIVIANEAITTAMTNMNGIISLAPSSVGPAYANHMIEKGDLLKLSTEVIKPFYQQKALRAVELLQQAITDERFRIHKPEGAIFLWLWFDELPITTMELYTRLKARGVLIVPGEYFFIGQEEGWDHAHQCLRMNYVQDDEMMQKGITIIFSFYNVCGELRSIVTIISCYQSTGCHQWQSYVVSLLLELHEPNQYAINHFPLKRRPP